MRINFEGPLPGREVFDAIFAAGERAISICDAELPYEEYKIKMTIVSKLSNVDTGGFAGMYGAPKLQNR
jgi:hypothetical protein